MARQAGPHEPARRAVVIGYTTEFVGQVNIDPPLNEHEIAYLHDFNQSRRMDREEGPYYAVPGNDFGQQHTPGIRNYNGPPKDQPGLWCQWVPAARWAPEEAALGDGGCLEWDGGEKFYYAAEWMRYIIDHFLRPGAVAALDLMESIKQDSRFEHFTFDHVLNGEIEAQGEDPGDRWKLVVRDNKVLTAVAQIVWPDPS